MRKPKHRRYTPADCHSNRYMSHDNGNANSVTISVLEKDNGQIIVEIDHFEGDVRVIGPNFDHALQPYRPKTKP